MLDDTLSAVDAYVGHEIIEEALFGVLANKTRILVLNTFLPSVLPRADRVIVMNRGRIEVQGKIQDCLVGSTWLRGIYDEQSGVAVANSHERKSPKSTKLDYSKTSVSLRSIDDERHMMKSVSSLYKEEERETGILKLSAKVVGS
jgi:ABC-type multidrug transport system ATPase subunit